MVSCQNENSNDVTYFGGKIINPKEGYVILFYQEKPIDTADIHSGAGWQHPFNLNDYRPISLLLIFSKILADCTV